jgi:hypothetical protein
MRIISFIRSKEYQGDWGAFHKAMMMELSNLHIKPVIILWGINRVVFLSFAWSKVS